MSPEHTALLRFLPEDRVGAVERVERLTMGQSGASVHAVTTSRGAYVLRVQAAFADEASFATQLRIVRRAAEAGIAPAIVHVDEAARAVVSERIAGVPMPAALANPAQRDAVIASVVDLLRRLHALDASDIPPRDPVAYVRTTYDAVRHRSGFPAWARALSPLVERIATTLADDPRRVVSHNDVNPGNVMWDGTQPWLVDWDVAGLGHPHYDLAVLAMFMRLDDEVAFALAARHDGARLDDRGRTTFHALRQLAGLLSGLTFLSMVDDLGVRSAATRADAPTLMDCFAAMRAGELDLGSASGRAMMGLALLAQSVDA